MSPNRTRLNALRFVVATLCALAVDISPVPGLTGTGAADPAWERVIAGIMVALWNPAPACPEIPPFLMLEIDPDRFQFSVHQFRDAGLATPPTIVDWQRQTGGYVLFNAGLFREDYSYLGLLMTEGRSLGSKRHHSWQGVFVAEPTEPAQRKARVLDLAFDTLPTESRQFSYQEAAQSLMLLDRTGKPRVRPTGKRAHQTIVAEDAVGKILILKSAGPAPLYGLAECLRDAHPNIKQAMAMDGGSSSDVIASPELLSLIPDLGTKQEWRSLLEGHATHHIGLPAVIAVRPRTAGHQPSRTTLHNATPAR